MSAIFGLTGGIGSGKSTIAEAFASLGIDLVDADVVAREVVEPGTPALAEIREHFGESILQPDGGLDRAALRRIVFADEKEKLWLEALLHPLINQEIQRQLANTTSPYALLISPLLLEGSQKELVQSIIVVDVSEDTQLKRTLARDGSDSQTIRAIIAAQIDRNSRLAAADYVIDNEGPIEAGIEQVETLHSQLMASLHGSEESQKT